MLSKLCTPMGKFRRAAIFLLPLCTTKIQKASSNLTRTNGYISDGERLEYTLYSPKLFGELLCDSESCH